MMEQSDIDQMAYLVVGNEMRRIAKEAAAAALASFDVPSYVYRQLGDVDTNLFDKIVESGKLIKDGGVYYVSIKDANEVRWERENHEGVDAFSMRFTDSTPMTPPF